MQFIKHFKFYFNCFFLSTQFYYRTCRKKYYFKNVICTFLITFGNFYFVLGAFPVNSHKKAPPLPMKATGEFLPSNNLHGDQEDVWRRKEPPSPLNKHKKVFFYNLKMKHSKPYCSLVLLVLLFPLKFCKRIFIHLSIVFDFLTFMYILFSYA